MRIGAPLEKEDALASNTAVVALDADRVKELITREEESFRAGRRRSDELWREARRVEPREVPSSFQDAAPQPVFVERGKGSRIWDVDGNEYVDFHNGFGVMVVGHAHPLIVKAVSERIALGSHFAQPGPDVAAVAGDLAKRFGQPQWRFTNSGTESTLDAVRLARAFPAQRGGCSALCRQLRRDGPRPQGLS
jgi:glutamate-1-semialdehyde 2,1-aminomutase